MSLIQRPLSMLGATDLSLIFLSEAHRKFQLLISCYWRGTLQSLSLFRVFTNYFVRPTFIHGDVNSLLTWHLWLMKNIFYFNLQTFRRRPFFLLPQFLTSWGKTLIHLIFWYNFIFSKTSRRKCLLP